MFNEPVSFILGALLNLLVVVAIVRFIYYPSSHDKNFVFSSIAFSAVIYFVLQFLTSTELSMGVGFGLFAIFSILRYRTSELPIREMTYLFTVIGLAVMNSFITTTDLLLEMGIANIAVVGLLYVLEREWGFTFESSKRIVYDKTDLIAPANAPRMLADLQARTGLPLTRFEIERIDFLRDVVDVRIYFHEPRSLSRRRGSAPAFAAEPILVRSEQ